MGIALQSLNRYVYARDNPMKIVDLAGHEWWNPVADISAATNYVAGAVTNLANAASNAWNSLPPDEKIGAIALVSIVAIAATAGVASGAVAAIDAGTVGSILATGAAMTGLPVIAEGSENVGPDVFASESGAWQSFWAHIEPNQDAIQSSDYGSMSTNGRGRVGLSIVANILTDSGFTVTQEQDIDSFPVTLPNGDPHEFTPDLGVNKGAFSGYPGFGVEVKTNSFWDTSLSRAQVGWYEPVFGRGNYAYAFVDITPKEVGQGFLDYLHGRGGVCALYLAPKSLGLNKRIASETTLSSGRTSIPDQPSFLRDRSTCVLYRQIQFQFPIPHKRRIP